MDNRTTTPTVNEVLRERRINPMNLVARNETVSKELLQYRVLYYLY